MFRRPFDDTETRLREELNKGRGDTPLSVEPVSLEPPYRPFGRNGRAVPERVRPARRVPLSHLRVRLPREDIPPTFVAEQFLLALKPVAPVAFEVIGQEGRVLIQFTCAESDAPGLRQQLVAAYPMVEVVEAPDALPSAGAVRGYGLKESPIFCLRTDGRVDPFIALAGILGHVRAGTALQVLFQPVRFDWSTNLLVASRDPYDPSKSPYRDVPDLPKLAEKKTAKPLFAVSVRLVGSELDRLEGYLAQFDNSNGFVRLREPEPIEAVHDRMTYRPGMLLNSEEVAALVHPPFAVEVLEHAPVERARLTAPAPEFATKDRLITFGTNVYQGQERPVGISDEWLTRHWFILGITGSGKTNLELVIIADRASKGGGFVYITPKRQDAEKALMLIPEHRIDDVIYLNFGDRDFPPALNLFGVSREREKEFIVSDAVVCFQYLFEDNWGPTQELLIRSGIRTLVYSAGEKTLRDLPLLFFDAEYRRNVLESVDDPDIQTFWAKVYPKVSPQSTTAVYTKLSKFLDRPIIRNIVSQPNRIDLEAILRDGKILIITLPQGELGRDAATFLGAVSLARLQLAAESRCLDDPALPVFPIIIDELQNYAGRGANTALLESGIAENRFRRVPYIKCTQTVHQLAESYRPSVLSTGTLTIFRCSMLDAQIIQREMGRFSAEDLLNQSPGEAICRMGRAEDSFPVKVFNLQIPTRHFRNEIIQLSRMRYCRPKDEVDRLFRREPTKVLPAEIEEPGGPGAPPLSEEEKRVLAFVADHPGLRVTQVYQALGLSGYTGDKLKAELLKKELLQAVKVPRPKGGKPIKLLFASAPGHRLLGLAVPPGKGGPLHRHLQQTIKKVAQKQGYRAVIEETIPGTNAAVDVGLERNGRRVAVEISVSNGIEDTLADLRKCLKAGYDEVVVVLFEEKAVREVETRAKQSLTEPEQLRVKFSAAKEVDACLGADTP